MFLNKHLADGPGVARGKKMLKKMSAQSV